MSLIRTPPPGPRASRRAVVLGMGAAAACWGLAPRANAQPQIPGMGQSRSPEIVQVIDTSALQSDVSKDFLIGCRAAFQEASQGNGRVPRHTIVETDGGATGVKQAVRAALANANCVGLMGSVGNAVANRVSLALKEADSTLAHCAPWLQTGQDVNYGGNFLVFASRSNQIGFALRSLGATGVHSIGAVFSNAADQAEHLLELEAVASANKVKVVTYAFSGDLSRMGASLGPDAPTMLVFFGGTPELIEFANGMQNLRRMQFLIGLSDVNLSVFRQLVPRRSLSVVATQPVPQMSGSLLVVRDFRLALARYFDEPPTPQSLAGYIAARYTLSACRQVSGKLDRDALAAALRSQPSFDIGGFLAGHALARSSPTYVTQSMLSTDGKILG